jgi:hypothetical protein
MSNAETKVSVCNGCSASQIKEIALKSQRYFGKVHVVDLTTGQVKTFDVEHETEPGFEFDRATSISTDSETRAAAQAVNNLINAAKAKGGTFDKVRSILTETVSIPKEIASTSTDVRDYLISQNVSQHLREKLLQSFWQKFSAAWQKVVQKILFKVQAKFEDGSIAIYTIGPIFFSDHPFVLERDSLKDANGNPVSSSGSAGSGSSEDIGYEDTFLNSGLQAFTLLCRSYTTTSSDGGSWGGINCWYVGVP